MATNPSTAAKLPCEQCAYLNEPERVYCHNCGAKLDRSLLPKDEAKAQESAESARKRISKMANPRPDIIGRELKALIQVAIYAALTAALILIAQKPDGVPEGKRKLALRLVSSDLAEAMESPSPRAIAFTEEEVNQFLKQLLKSKEGTVPGVRFERAFVNLRPEGIRISSENSVWGYSLFSGIEYWLEVKDGKFVERIIGGNFGRLAVHPKAMEYASIVFDKMWTALARERKQMDRLSSVQVRAQRVDLVTKGSAGVR